MTSGFASAARALSACALVCALLVLLPAEPLLAHGGRTKPIPPRPGGSVPPDRPPPQPPGPPPPPPDLPAPPTTPNPTKPPGDGLTPGGGKPANPSPTTGKPGTKTPGRQRRTTHLASAEFEWQTWWALNRWRFFPDRGSRWLRAGAVVTPAGKKEVDPAELAASRRLLVARQQIAPFLLRQLDPAGPARDEVRAAAAIALARVTHDEEAVRLLFRHAEDPRAAPVVRESAALAVGLLRRSAPEGSLAGSRLDEIRARLLKLVDDGDAPDRTRAFAAFALGLLGDQPFGSPFTKEGRVVTRALWERLSRKHSSREIPVALLTSLGMQPAEGTSLEVKEGLRYIAGGRRMLGRRWDADERSHALSALVRQRGHGWPMLLMRTLTTKRLQGPVRRAAFIALGAHADHLEAEDRLPAAQAALKGVRLARDALTRGLGHLAFGRLLGADLRAGTTDLLLRTAAAPTLLGEAGHGPRPVRGFSALGLALAARGVVSGEAETARFTQQATATLLRGFERTTDDGLRGAYAVGLGLLRDSGKPVVQALSATLEDRAAAPELRGHVALALAQIGDRSLGVLRAVRTAMYDRRSPDLRSEAALALSFLGGPSDTKMLTQELEKARSQWVLAQIASALGQLGDVAAVPAVLALASDAGRDDESRALAIASLGLLGDPEPRPSLLQLSLDANYPAHTAALREAFTIL